MTTSFLTVGATRLERATAWSQTRSATNCATPRKAAAKVHLSAEMTKSNRLFFGKRLEKSCERQAAVACLSGHELATLCLRAPEKTNLEAS